MSVSHAFGSGFEEGKGKAPILQYCHCGNKSGNDSSKSPVIPNAHAAQWSKQCGS
jgi:hypothetical protein